MLEISAALQQTSKLKDQLTLTQPQKVCIFLIEKSGELLLPYLDRHDKDKLQNGNIAHSNLSLVSIAWNSAISSFNLFSTIVKSIKDVVVEEELKSHRAGATHQIKKIIKSSEIDTTKKFASTRMLPASVLKKKVSDASFSAKKPFVTSEVIEEVPPIA